MVYSGKISAFYYAGLYVETLYFESLTNINGSINNYIYEVWFLQLDAFYFSCQKYCDLLL